MHKKLNIFLVFVVLILASTVVYAEGVRSGEIVGTQDATVCCEKTNAGLHCQDVKEEDCAADSQFKLPTACSSTQPCDPGYCYDSSEGTCLDNVPQMICNEEGGTWSATKPASCNLGCCVLGDQASFVTLVRCKRLSSFYGLQTNFNPDIQNDVQCILSARAEEKGACVFEQDFEKTCKLVKRSQCTSDKVLKQDSSASTAEIDKTGKVLNGDSQTNSVSTNEQTTSSTTKSSTPAQSPPTGCQDVGGGVEFCPGMLCSAEELHTNCGPSDQTSCVDGKEEIYYMDTCGNPANIYDASKRNDDNYWSYLKDKSDSCDPNDASIDSQTCGNCNYLLGSYCGATSAGSTKPTYGSNICIDLNCQASEMTGGKERLHGESWCGFDTKRDFSFHEPENPNSVQKVLSDALQNVQGKKPVGATFLGSNVPVGSKFYRYICSHGEVIVEPCADFRQEECIENEVAGYSEAACRVNRWQDCTSVFKKADCENTDQRDCTWLDGIEYVLIGGLGNGSTIDKSSLSAAKGQLKQIKTGDRELGACVPKTPPGLKFWGDKQVKIGESQRGTNGPATQTPVQETTGNEDTMTVCSQANAVCPVKYEKGLVGGEWKCVENCECLDDANHLKRAQLCMSLGDCGPKVNIIGQMGRGKGWKFTDGIELEAKK